MFFFFNSHIWCLFILEIIVSITWAQIEDKICEIFAKNRNSFLGIII